MKRVHRNLVLAAVALGTCGLGALGARQVRADMAPVQPATPVFQTAPSQADDADMNGVAQTPERDLPSQDHAAPLPPAPTPLDLEGSLVESKRGQEILLKRARHLVTVFAGDQKYIGLGEVRLPHTANDSPLIWETVDSETLTMLRGSIVVGAGSLQFENTVAPPVISTHEATGHSCAGMNAAVAGFVVICRVKSAAAAASLDGNRADDGVWSLVGESTLVRLDLPLAGNGALARAVGYERAGVGVLIRAEASRVPGESEALLSIGADSRTQPGRIIRRCCSCFRSDPPLDLGL